MQHLLFEENRIIQIMRNQNDFSEESLKRSYRALCKEHHPDTGGSTDDFIKLSEEYESAKSGLIWLQEYFKHNLDIPIPLPLYKRLTFYLALKRYTAAGLFSVKVRMRENLRERNRIILQDVVKRSQDYDESFTPIFLNFNRNHLKKYSLWLTEKNMKSGRNYFLKGLNFFFDYELRGAREMFNIAYSYIEDSIYDLKHTSPSPIVSATLDFSTWLLNEVKKESLVNLIKKVD